MRVPARRRHGRRRTARSALGATRGHIRLQFLVEAMLLAGTGGLVGVLLGALITAAFATSRAWPLSLPLAGLAVAIAAPLPPAEAVS